MAEPAAERFSDMFDAFAAAGMHAWRWNLETSHLTWSEGTNLLLGLPSETPVETFDAYLAVIPPDDRDRVEAAVDEALRGVTQEFYVEHRIVRAGAGERWVAGQGRVFRDRDGRAVRMAGVVWDITERKRTEANTARLMRLWSVVREINRSILRGTTEADLFDNACRIVVEVGHLQFAWVGLVSTDGARVEPVAWAGAPADYLDGLTIEVADTPNGRGPGGSAVRSGRPSVVNDTTNDPAFAPWREAALAHGFRSCAAFPLRRGKRVVGTLTVYSERKAAFDDEEMDLLGSLAKDINDVLGREERTRAAENAALVSEERYRAVFEQAFEGIFLVGADHSIRDVNESACRMLGYTRSELLARRAVDVIDPVDLTGFPLRFQTIPRGGVIVSERRFRRKDASVMHGELTTKALLDGNFQVVVRDVTERAQVQAQLLLTDRLSSLGRLASGIAHEINNPLAYLTLNLSMVAGYLLPEARPGHTTTLEKAKLSLESACEGAERVRQIVRTLTHFGRGDQDRVGPVDVNAIIESAVEVASLHLRHRAVITKSYDAATVAKGNAFRLGQVFVNLLVNAADALPDGGPSNEVRVRTYSSPDGGVVAEVEDNGAGIPSDLHSRIFDPFFTTKEVGRGMGLGLSVCYAIVSSLGGTIECTSVPGKTVFRVALPPMPAANDGESVEEREPVAADPAPAPVRGRVLVVDDDARVAAAMADALSDHDVYVARSGREAIERCRRESFDCILCDVVMPEVSGLDVLHTLEGPPFGIGERVVLMTGGAVTEPIREALRRADHPVLEKPIERDALRAAVAATMERVRGASSETAGGDT